MLILLNLSLLVTTKELLSVKRNGNNFLMSTIVLGKLKKFLQISVNVKNQI